MYYEIYIDVLFLENFILNSMILLTVRKIQKASGKNWRAFLGGAAGALGICILIVIKVPLFFKYLIAFVFLDTVMIFISMDIKNIIHLLQVLITFFATSVLMGGVFYIFRPYLRSLSLFYGVSIFTYYCVRKMWEIILCFKKQQRNIYNVTLLFGNKEMKLRALEDTGNQLYDLVSKEPVCVLGKKEAEILLGEKAIIMCLGKEINKFPDGLIFRYIPYQTISGKGVIPVVRMKKLIIHSRKEIVVESPLIGISGEPVSERQLYQMILNSDILGGTENVSKSSSTAAV